MSPSDDNFFRKKNKPRNIKRKLMPSRYRQQQGREKSKECFKKRKDIECLWEIYD